MDTRGKHPPAGLKASAGLVQAHRLSRMEELAQATFEAGVKAERWVRRPLSELGNKSPSDLAQTEDGAQVVETILANIAWGAL